MLIQSLSNELDPREKKKYYFDQTPFRRVLTPLVALIFRSFTVIKASGTDRLPESGAVVLAANHLTNFDVFPMQFVLPRPIFFMAKSELHSNPLLDALLRQLGSFPVNRGVRDEWAFRHAQRVLEHGQVLGIFPEGKRSGGSGLRPAKTGAARLALEANCPIVPVAVLNTHNIFKHFPRRTRIQIRVGDTLIPDEDDTALSLTDRLMFSLADLLPPNLRGVYSQKPDWL